MGLRTSTAVEDPQAFARTLNSAAGRIATEWAARLAAMPAFATRDGASLEAACAAHLHALARWLGSAADDDLRRAVIAQTQACMQTGLALADAVRSYVTLDDLLWDELERETAGPVRSMAAAKRLSAGLGVTVLAVASEYQRATASRLALQREEQERLALRLERTQVRDAATDLYTRAYCLDVLDREARLAHRYAYPLSLLVIDVDDFDALTVGLGTEERDEVVRGLAGQLVSAVREVDLVCRLGHDTFGVILSHIPAGAAAGVAERLRLAVQDWTLSVGDVRLDRRATISVGVAGLPEHASTAGELFLRAEAAQAHAKRAGKNMVVSARDVPA